MDPSPAEPTVNWVLLAIFFPARKRLRYLDVNDEQD